MSRMPSSTGDRTPLFLVTCEHGGNRIPERYRPLFRSQEAQQALASHRGWDPGALPLARGLAAALGAPLRYSTTSRLLVDLNRSEESPELLSEFSRELEPAERGALIRRYHRPYRNRVRHLAARGSPDQPVVHLSVHTFTPVLEGRRRKVGMGVLFDPEREPEAEVAEGWIGRLREVANGWAGKVREVAAGLGPLRVEANQPYLGTADGFTTTLRGELPEERYIGLELEVRQDLVKWFLGPVSSGVLGVKPLAESLREACGALP